MKVTVTFEEEQDWDGKAWSLTYAKEVDYIEDYLYTVGKAGSIMFDGMCSLEATQKFFDQDGNRKTYKFNSVF